MSCNALLLAVLISLEFALSADIALHGYVYNIYVDELQMDSDTEFEDIYLPLIDSQLDYHHGNDTNIWLSVNSLNNFFWSFTIRYTDIHDVTTAYDPYIMTQNINNHVSNNYTLTDEYIVITSIFNSISCDNNNCNRYSLEGYTFNNASWMKLVDSQNNIYNNFSFITYNVFGNILLYVNLTNSSQWVPYPWCNFDEITRNLFYPHSDGYHYNSGATAFLDIDHNSTKFEIIGFECTNLEYNVQIFYQLDSLKGFKTDIQNIDYFNTEKMKNQWSESTSGGTFDYYSLGGICTGSFCIEGINWLVPNNNNNNQYSSTINTIITSMDDVTNDDSDEHTWMIIVIIFICLFFISMFIIGFLLYALKKRQNDEKAKYTAAPTTEMEASNKKPNI